MSKPAKTNKTKAKKRIEQLREARAQAERDLAAQAVSIEHRIGTEADEKLLKILQGNGMLPMPGSGDLALQASPQLVAAIRLGLQRSGRLVEKQEITDVRRPLREASESELIAELEGRDGSG